jgi:hypothetical protein
MTVSTVGLLFGGFYVLLATPIAAVLATLVDVVVLDEDPAEQNVPPLIFPARDAGRVGAVPCAGVAGSRRELCASGRRSGRRA